MNTENRIYAEAVKQFAWMCLYIILTRLTHGAFLFVMTLMGVVFALNGRVGKAFSIYTLIMFMIVMNPIILPKDNIMFGVGSRFGPLFIGLVLASREFIVKNRYRLPFGGLIIFLVVAAISSANGWAPMVSYLKLANFLVFVIGIWIGAQGLANNAREVFTMRASFFALSVFIIAGSAVLIPFPSISTLNALRQMGQGVDMAYLNEVIRDLNSSGAIALFCGVTSHSQALSPILSCAFAWVLFDALFIEEKIRKPHLLLLLLCIPLLYKTRSRVAFLCFIITFLIVYFYLPSKMAMSVRYRKWLGAILSSAAVVIIFAATTMEVYDGSISKWVRKTNDVKGDSRSLQEAVTASRQGTIELCMDDFARNPWLGMGFQVAVYTPIRSKSDSGLILSAPIEKGVLPIMLLGESGVIGTMLFFIFVWSFFQCCSRNRLYLTIGFMCILLALNLGEATFFSPGGIGGIEWMYCILGGYTLDMWFMAKSKMVEPYR